jgi:hypothetical protein
MEQYDRVKVLKKGIPPWIDGVIEAVREGNRYKVRFEDGTTEDNIPQRNIQIYGIPTTGYIIPFQSDCYFKLISSLCFIQKNSVSTTQCMCCEMGAGEKE